MNFVSGANAVKLLIVLLTSVPVVADDVSIDFFGPGNLSSASDSAVERALENGTITYLGGAKPLSGSNINISGVRAANTPANAGSTFKLKGLQPFSGLGTLSFTTGTFVGMTAGLRQFAGGGAFALWGAVPQAGVGFGKLLWGTVTGALVNNDGTMKLSIMNGTDKMAPSLVSFFGLDPNKTLFEFSATLNATRVGSQAANGAFLAIATGNTSISNAVVPEPASMALLGSALLLISWKLWKKLGSAQRL
jgi:hypothetical protein